MKNFFFFVLYDIEVLIIIYNISKLKLKILPLRPCSSEKGGMVVQEFLKRVFTIM